MSAIEYKLARVGLLAAILTSTAAFASDEVSAGASDGAPPPPNPVTLHLPIIDSPFNLKHANPFPSMEQSLWITRGLYDSAHYGLHKLIEPQQGGWAGFWGRLVFAFADFEVLERIPLGEAWLHEEWHRAVMSNQGISSYNGVYSASPTQTLISVSHETDEDLVRLKRDHPADQIRLTEAGMEAEYELSYNLEQDSFFNENHDFRGFAQWYIHLSPTFYLWTCASKNADKETDKQNNLDGSDVAKRDFTGLDCDSWAYDLHRRDEPFAARGVHPSGIGIDRYRKFSALAPEEQRYLVQARNLSLLNFVDPFLWRNTRGFVTGGLFGEHQAAWTMTLRHLLTSFGTVGDVNFFYRSSVIKALATLHVYRNQDRSFPGVELRLFDFPLTPASQWVGQLRAQAWQQPREQRFATRDAESGGLLGARLAYHARHDVAPYVEMTGKTAGWVAGQVELERNLQTVGGLEWTL